MCATQGQTQMLLECYVFGIASGPEASCNANVAYNYVVFCI